MTANRTGMLQVQKGKAKRSVDSRKKTHELNDTNKDKTETEVDCISK